MPREQRPSVRGAPPPSRPVSGMLRLSAEFPRTASVCAPARGPPGLFAPAPAARVPRSFWTLRAPTCAGALPCAGSLRSGAPAALSPPRQPPGFKAAARVRASPSVVGSARPVPRSRPPPVCGLPCGGVALAVLRACPGSLPGSPGPPAASPSGLRGRGGSRPGAGRAKPAFFRFAPGLLCSRAAPAALGPSRQLSAFLPGFCPGFSPAPLPSPPPPLGAPGRRQASSRAAPPTAPPSVPPAGCARILRPSLLPSLRPRFLIVAACQGQALRAAIADLDSAAPFLARGLPPALHENSRLTNANIRANILVAGLTRGCLLSASLGHPWASKRSPPFGVGFFFCPPRPIWGNLFGGLFWQTADPGPARQCCAPTILPPVHNPVFVNSFFRRVARPLIFEHPSDKKAARQLAPPGSKTRTIQAREWHLFPYSTA